MTRRIAFDTSVFIAFFEHQIAHDIGAIQNMVDEVDSGRVRLVVPTLVIAELYCKTANSHLIDAFMRSPSVLVTDLTISAAKLAGSAREYCIDSLGFKPGMPDTLITASSQFGGADTIFTCDAPMLRLAGCNKFTIKIKPPQRLSDTDYDAGLLDNLDNELR